MRALARWLGLASLSAPLTCLAQAPLSQVWINPGFYSVHFDRNAGLEDANYGIGIEWPLTDMLSFTAGGYRNSERMTSHYVGMYVMPLEWKGFRFGVAVGGFDGYPRMNDGGWFPAVVPVVSYEHGRLGLNVGFIPEYKDRLNGAITFQLKFRFEAPPSAGAVAAQTSP
ncbi:hypothetical protein QTH91_01310 [Variovorax dokdonensis]|uniref:Uncharacterized protein n=1 Tax=Variovorax dokdonensis TaxID=344883 RepID=A0ABT7N597_9BURK|nr:hypothetical protein [Variovorax dokdonensis]MDM0043108.1 hypothetical protein [Variovorax dokdonensis]